MAAQFVYQRILECGLMPTTFVYDLDETVHLAKTLWDNGIGIIELLQRTPDALRAIGIVKQNVPGMVVGAGTVRETGTARSVIDAGADYVVSPFYSQEIVDLCLERGVAVVPGCATITEVSQGYQSGLRCFKIFPAKQLGGVEGIRQISEIYSDARYVVTGGFTFEDVLDYAPNKYVAAIGSVCMMPQESIRAHDWDRIAALTARTVAASLGFAPAYVNAPDGVEGALFRSICLGALGHLGASEVPPALRALEGEHAFGLYTNSIRRALAWFAAQGAEGSILLSDPDGVPVAADVRAGGRSIRLIARHYVDRT